MVLVCPHCSLQIDCTGLTGTVSCPNCQRPFLVPTLPLNETDEGVPARGPDPGSMSRRDFEARVKRVQSKAFVCLGVLGGLILPMAIPLAFMDPGSPTWFPIGFLVLAIVAFGLPVSFWYCVKYLPKCPKCARTIIGLHASRVLKTHKCPHCKSSIIRK